MSTQSVFRRRRLASMARIIQPRDRPPSLGPLPMGFPTLVATTHCSRSVEISLPVTRSDSPLAYASAVSMKLIPAARAESTMRPASAASVRAPNIIVPRQMGETLMPLLPSFRYSMSLSLKQHCHPESPSGDKLREGSAFGIAKKQIPRYARNDYILHSHSGIHFHIVILSPPPGINFAKDLLFQLQTKADSSLCSE